MSFDVGLPSVPFQVTNEPIVNLAVIYNVFDLSDIEKHELEWTKGKTLADYICDLPKEVQWGVGLNGVAIEKGDEKALATVIEKGDIISIAALPEGDGGVKDVLRVVALVAVTVATAGAATGAFGLAAGSWGALGLSAAIGIGGSLLINALLPMQMPTFGDLNAGGEATKTYGIDGAKNTSNEGGPVPVIYGEYRIGGNFCDIYTINSGDTQVLYLRNVINDGEITSVSEPLINDQPVDNFSDVDWHYSLGTNTDAVDTWFPDAIRMQNKGQKIDTSGIVHTTVAPIDRARFDVIFPKGLVTIDEKTGEYSFREVDFEIHYSAVGANSWNALSVGQWQKITGTTTPASTTAIKVDIETANNLATIDFTLQYRIVGAPSWTDWVSDVFENDWTNVEQSFVGEVLTDVFQYAQSHREYEIALPSNTYEVRLTSASGNVYLRNVRIQRPGSNKVKHSRAETGALRFSIESASLPRGLYDLRIRRVGAEADNGKTILDEAWISDIAEIDDSPAALRNTATASLRIMLTDQLNGVPKVTWLVKCKLKEYDLEGNTTVVQYSANPAWIVLDMLIGDQRGVGFPVSRIDFAGFYDWANYCTTNGLEFHGVFDAGTNLWDAMVQVMKVGHAVPLRSGIKLSVAIEGSTEPSMVFGSSAIMKDSFSISYHATGDRANEIEATYYDKDNYHKPTTIRVVDPEAETYDQPQKTAALNLFGVDNHTQAVNEVWRQIYSNRLIKRTCSFEAPVEAIGITIGDVAYIQHEMTDWANAGRLLSGSTVTALNLDRPVIMESGKTYGVLVHYPAIKQYDSSVSSVVGQTIYVTGIPASPYNINRFIQGSLDVGVVKVEWGSPLTALTVEGDVSSVTNSSCELWLTDAIFERAVTFNLGEHSSIICASLPEAPVEGVQWVFGETASVKRPYRLTGITGAGYETRRLTFVEYNEDVYGIGERVIPPDTVYQSDTVKHVTNLAISYKKRMIGDQREVAVKLTWKAGDVLDYGGADIYMRVNGGDWRAVATVQTVTEYNVSFNADTTVGFKVVAFNKKGYRASQKDIPFIEKSIIVESIDLDEPLNVLAVLDVWNIEARVKVTWDPPADDSRVETYGIEWRNVTPGKETNWIPLPNSNDFEVKIEGFYVGDYEIRVRSLRGYSQSIWVTYNLTLGPPEIQAMTSGLTFFDGVPEVATDTFTGKDMEWSWDVVAFNVESGRDHYFLDYLVVIKDALDNILRQESVPTESYTYTYEKNVADNIGDPTVWARRTVKIEVYSRGRQGQVSAPAVMTVSNPLPAVPTGISVVGGFDTTYISFIPPDDTDYLGCQIYLGTTTGFTRNAGSLVYEGPSNNISLDTPAATEEDRYVYIRPYDAFDKIGLNESSEFHTTNRIITVDADQENWMVDGFQFTAEGSTPNQLTWTAGTVNVEKGDVRTAYPVDAGSFDWTSGTVYIYYDKGQTTLQTTTNIAVATAITKRVFAVYKGGYDLVVSHGDVIIDGAKVLAGTIAAGNLVADQAVITGAIQVADGIITNAKIANIIQSADWDEGTKTGWKIDKTGQIQGRELTVYDNTGTVIFDANGGQVRGRNLFNLNNWVKGEVYADGETIGVDGGEAANTSAGASSYTWIGEASAGPHGARSLCMYCRSGPTTSASGGGFNNAPLTAAKGYSPDKAYMYVCYVKRTSQTNGGFYLGCSTTETLNINGTVNSNPYFLSNVDTPLLDRWYLCVGILQANVASTTSGIGGMYDMITGEKIVNANEFKSAAGAVEQSMRAFQYYTTVSDIYTFIADPQVYAIDGSEPTILQLLGIAGETFIGNAAITTAKIQDAAINTAKIANLAVGSSQIANAAITTAKIGNLQVTNAQIANLTVGGEKIQNGAISDAASYYAAATSTFGTTATTIAQVTIDTTDAYVVHFNFTGIKISPTSNGTVTLYLYRGGSSLASIVLTEYYGLTIEFSYPWGVADSSPLSGSNTYYIKAAKSSGTAGIKYRGLLGLALRK